jgi:hypothetical protein
VGVHDGARTTPRHVEDMGAVSGVTKGDDIVSVAERVRVSGGSILGEALVGAVVGLVGLIVGFPVPP